MSEEKNQEMIKIQSTRFGELEVPTESIFEIVYGIIGFSNFRKYILLEHNPPFSWIQSTENPDLAFVVVNGEEFGDAYSVPFPVGDRDIDLQESDVADVAVLNLVSVRADPSKTTVNLKAPVIVNMRNRKGRQLVLDDQKYPTRMPLFAAEGEQPATEGGGEPQKED